MTHTFDQSLVSDLHKDAYGFRPRFDFWNRWSKMTDDEKQAEWTSLIASAQDTADWESARQDRAEADVTAAIARICETVSGATREDAIRYLDDANNAGGDRGYLEFLLEVRYGFLGGPKY